MQANQDIGHLQGVVEVGLTRGAGLTVMGASGQVDGTADQCHLRLAVLLCQMAEPFSDGAVGTGPLVG
jgi:hypothetical protein